MKTTRLITATAVSAGLVFGVAGQAKEKHESPPKQNRYVNALQCESTQE
jgi:hypothetical protein